MKILLVMILFFISSNLESKNICTDMFSKERGLCKLLRYRGVNDNYIKDLFKKDLFYRRDAISKNFLTEKKFRIKHLKEKYGKFNFGKEVPRVKKNLREYRTVYRTVEKKYGVNKEIIASILMKETNIGKKRPYHNAFVALNTIYMEFMPVNTRNKKLINMARNNLVSLIIYSKKHKIPLNSKQFDSSYAGAIGINQFMPSSFVYAKAWSSKRKRANLWAMEDAITSTAYFLHKKAKFNKKINWVKTGDMKKIHKNWIKFSKNNKNSSFCLKKESNKKLNCFACNKPELEYTSKYIKMIMKYNFSSDYSMSVLKLAYLSTK